MFYKLLIYKNLFVFLQRVGLGSFRLNKVHSNIKDMRTKLALHLRIKHVGDGRWLLTDLL